MWPKCVGHSATTMYLGAARGAEDPFGRNMLTSERICNIGSSGKISKNIEGFSDDPNIYVLLGLCRQGRSRAFSNSLPLSPAPFFGELDFSLHSTSEHGMERRGIRQQEWIGMLWFFCAGHNQVVSDFSHLLTIRSNCSTKLYGEHVLLSNQLGWAFGDPIFAVQLL